MYLKGKEESRILRKRSRTRPKTSKDLKSPASILTSAISKILSIKIESPNAKPQH